MRITSGILRNRRFEIPVADTRPTMESVREAMFSSLGGTFTGQCVLDLYAGSGSLGLEAWSRGAEQVAFVDNNSKIIDQINKTISMFKNNALGKTVVFQADVLRWIKSHTCQYDIIFADPPYELSNAFENILQSIQDGSVLTEQGRVVYELRAKQKFEVPPTWKILRDKRFGKTRFLILQKEKKHE